MEKFKGDQQPIDAVKKLALILEGKAQKAFLSNKKPQLIQGFKSVLADLDACKTTEELQIVAKANGIEITQEDLDFIVEG